MGRPGRMTYDFERERRVSMPVVETVGQSRTRRTVLRNGEMGAVIGDGSVALMADNDHL